MCGACSFAVMARCWCEDPEERPDFSELCSIMESFLGSISDYTEWKMVLLGDVSGMCTAWVHEVT